MKSLSHLFALAGAFVFAAHPAFGAPQGSSFAPSVVPGGPAIVGSLMTTSTATFGAAVNYLVITKAASFTFDATMYKIRANAASGAVTGTLPACTAATKGRTYILKKVDSSANAAIYATTGSDTIDGATAVSITTQYADVKVTCSDVVGAWDRGD